SSSSSIYSSSAVSSEQQLYMKKHVCNPFTNQSELTFSDSFRKEMTNFARSTMKECERDRQRIVEINFPVHIQDMNMVTCLLMAPLLMASYLNSSIRKAKHLLRKRGISMSTVDDNGRQVDLSCRPIDPIFKEA
ncbi:hypothetical protein PMAYCL1PPCAC_15995, partial [Pristionchus mayeri]